MRPPHGCRGRIRACLPVCLVLLAWVLGAERARAQLTFPSASPVSAGNVVVRLEPEITTFSGNASSAGLLAVGLYGASPDWTVIVQDHTLVSNAAPVTVGGHTANRTATGLGDTLMELRYTLYSVDDVGSTFRIAPYFGIFAPTGTDNANPAMPRGLQPGTGAWGQREAISATWSKLFWNAEAQVGYENYAQSAGYTFGDSFYADAGFHYLLWPRNLEGDVNAEVFASLETNYTATNKDRMIGATVPGSGGQLWTADPGIIYTTPRYSVDATALLPVYQHISAGGRRYAWGVLGLFRYAFFTEHHW